MTAIQIAIVEDESLVLSSLLNLFESTPDIEVVLATSSVEELLKETVNQTIDIVLLDIGLPGGMSGLEGIRPIKKKFEHAEIIILTTFEESDKIFKALCAGAVAYLTKRTPFKKIEEAIRTVYRGGSYMSPVIAKEVVQYFAPSDKEKTVLSPRQEQIVEGIVQGLSYKMVADQLLISPETVKDHIKKIYRKLEIHSKGELIQLKLRGDLD